MQAMEQGLREVCRSVRIGKILIQRVNQFFDATLSTRGAYLY
jgi:uracil phosphoribosyltransferase